LGAPLCGEVPRVRFMRRWFFKDPLPDGQPRAIPVDNEFRHDTLNKGHNSDYEYLDQADDVPQMIFPKIFARSGAVSCLKGKPHPVLAFGLDAIRFLPDHVHEGECYVPDNLYRRFKFCDYGGEDFPAEPGKENERIKPEVIAWAQITDPHITQNFLNCYPTGQVASFGVIGAYKGQSADVGNVVVDSSFHHFINFNLCGFVNSQDKLSKDKGQYAYEQIKTYFRNIGVWLARRKTQGKVFNRALVISLWTYPLIEEILSLRAEIDSNSLKWKDYYRLGTAARTSLGRLISPALAQDESFRLFESLLSKNYPGLFREISRTDLTDIANLLFGINLEVIYDSLLGAVTTELIRSFGDDRQSSLDVTDTKLSEMTNTGASEAINMFSKYVTRYVSELNRIAEAFNQELE
jgi:hypothetical protein